MEFGVRRACIEDTERLVDLRMELQREVGELDDADREVSAQANGSYMRDALPSGQFICWVAEAEGEIIGTSGLVLYRRPPSVSNLGGVEAYLMNMYTVPPWRRHGIGSTLLTRCIEHATAAGAGKIRLHASQAGCPMYKHAAFLPSDNEMVLSLAASEDCPTKGSTE